MSVNLTFHRTPLDCKCFAKINTPTNDFCLWKRRRAVLDLFLVEGQSSVSLTPRGRGLFVAVSWIKGVTGELEVKVPEHAQCRARDDSDKQTFTAKLMYQIYMYVYLHESLFILVSIEDTFSFIWINRSKEETNSIKQICAIIL